MAEFQRQVKELLYTDTGSLTIAGKLISAAINMLILMVIYVVIKRLFERWLSKRRYDGGKMGIRHGRVRTLGNSFMSLGKWILGFIWLLLTLDTFGVSTKSLIATAGLSSLAIGFGAQSLVKDIITGFFILLEDQYSIGDYVKIGNYEGYVEELGVRVTKLRDFSGALHIIPNSSVTVVSNSSRGAMRSLVKVSIAYEEDIDHADEVLGEMCENLRKEKDTIFIEGPSVLGVTNLGPSDVVFTLVGKTKPDNQWKGERLLLRGAKYALNNAGISIPYPKTDVYILGERGGRINDTKL